MKTLITSTFTMISIIVMIWFLASWANIIAHNGPYDDGDPADWNMFIVISEVAK